MTATFISTEERERRSKRVLLDALDAIEGFADSYDSEEPKHRLALVQLMAGLCLATVLERAGPLRLVRTVFGALLIAFRWRGLVQP